jgi:acyl carrier protein
MSDVAADVIAIVSARLPKPQTLQMSDRLEDLGISSLSVAEVIFDLEEKLDIEIVYNSNVDRLPFETVGELVDAVRKLVAGKAK